MPTSERGKAEFGSSNPNLTLPDDTKSIESALASFQQALTGVYSALGGTNQDGTIANQIYPGSIVTEETVNVTLARPRPQSSCERVVLKIKSSQTGGRSTADDHVVFDGAFQVKLPKAKMAEPRPLSEEMEKTAKFLLSHLDKESPVKPWKNGYKWLIVGISVFIFTVLVFLTTLVLWLVL